MAKSSASFPRERQIKMSTGRIITHIVDLDSPITFTPEQIEMLEKLNRMPDSEIDYSDAPFDPNRVFKRVRQDITFRLDHNVVDWLKSLGEHSSNKVNEILRREMFKELNEKK